MSDFLNIYKDVLTGYKEESDNDAPDSFDEFVLRNMCEYFYDRGSDNSQQENQRLKELLKEACALIERAEDDVSWTGNQYEEFLNKPEVKEINK